MYSKFKLSNLSLNCHIAIDILSDNKTVKHTEEESNE